MIHDLTIQNHANLIPSISQEEAQVFFNVLRKDCENQIGVVITNHDPNEAVADHFLSILSQNIEKRFFTKVAGSLQVIDVGVKLSDVRFLIDQWEDFAKRFQLLP